MKEPNDFIEDPGQDAVLEGLLASLRQLEPSVDGRVRNRVAIADALRGLRVAAAKRDQPWWGRTLSIPIPVAAALVIAAGLGLVVEGYRGGRAWPTAPIAKQEQPAGGGNADRQTGNGHVVSYHATETYLCGVGRLKTESGYFVQE